VLAQARAEFESVFIDGDDALEGPLWRARAGAARRCHRHRAELAVDADRLAAVVR
jgi:hypothetical protein